MGKKKLEGEQRTEPSMIRENNNEIFTENQNMNFAIETKSEMENDDFHCMHLEREFARQGLHLNSLK